MTTARVAPVVVVADLDGTLVFDRRPMAPSLAAVLTGLATRPGVRLVLATSRAPYGIVSVARDLADHVDLLCCNGALRRDRRRGTTTRSVLPGPLVGRLVGLLLAAGADFCLDYGDGYTASAAAAFGWYGAPGRSVLATGRPPSTAGVVRLAVAHADRWLDRLRAECGRSAALFPHASGDLDIIARGVSKATALDALLSDEAATVVAIGNDINDRDLLVRADHAVVVGDLLPELDRFAHVARIEADDSRIARTLEQLVDQSAAARAVA